MKLLQNRYIPSSDPWEPHFYGFFWRSGETVCFVYDDNCKVSVLSYTNKSSTIIGTELGMECLPLPSHWIFMVIEDQPFLMVGPEAVINLQQGEQLASVPEKIQRLFEQRMGPEYYFESHPFTFSDYCISHKGQSGYCCTKAGIPIWDFKGKAYLYTDISQWHNRIFFGTAGYGGYFYILDIDTGKPVASIKTGGTACIAQMDHLCFVSSKTSKKNTSKIICIDLHDGRVVDELELYGGVTKESRLQLIGSQLHVVTFEYRGGRCVNAIWNVVAI